jgi:serine/threonine-protein kinase PknG
LAQLAAHRPEDALAFFAAVVAELPGELSPKLALAVAFELTAAARAREARQSLPEPPLDFSITTDDCTSAETDDDLRAAEHYYDIVSATDPGLASAGFGLSRVRMTLGDRAGAIAPLQLIPRTSSAYLDAQVALCRVRCAYVAGKAPELDDLLAASDVLDQLQLPQAVRLALVRDLHAHALRMLVEQQIVADDRVVLAGATLTETAIRAGLEATYRSLAKLAATDTDRWSLVDRANEHRPRTRT